MTTTKNCPYCDELISINAIKCKHCGSMLNVYSDPSQFSDSLTFVRVTLASKFEILSELGCGGMATVYKAVQNNLQRTVALKVIHQNLIHDREFLDKFHSEARMAASLNHQGIVSIYDEGTENNVHYISMEYLEGEDLHQIIRKKSTLTIEHTVNIVSSIADSLDYLHKKNLIHRDIKSSNIIITKEGRVVLTDFGIARAMTGSKLSRTGSVVGTPEYMSPEQADGLGADQRSDLYSLGVVLYECLSGCLPFSGENPVSTIYKIINTPPPPLSKFDVSIPIWLQSIVEKSLSKNPQNRFTTGKEFSTAIKARKRVKVTEGGIVSSKTRKIDRNKQGNLLPKNSQQAANTKYVKKRENSLGIVYGLGSIIVILLLLITFILIKDSGISTSRSKVVSGDNRFKELNQSDIVNIKTLLSSGDILLQSNNLFDPIGNNAYDTYKNVLELEPSNAHAKARLEKIYEQTYKVMQDELNRGNKVKADSLTNILRIKFPQKSSHLSDLNSNNEIQKILNKAATGLNKDNFTVNELNAINSEISKVLRLDPTNNTARELQVRLKKEYLILGDSFYRANQFNKALAVYQEAKNSFGIYDKLADKINDCRKKLEAESKVEVPDIVGKTLQEAQQILVHFNLSINKLVPVSVTPENRGKITWQFPKSGERVKRNSSITIGVGE